jgi:hypothetical protein
MFQIARTIPSGPKKSTGNFVPNKLTLDNISLVDGYRRRSQRKNPRANHARVARQRDVKAVQRQKKKK